MTQAEELAGEREAALIKAIERLAAAEERKADTLAILVTHAANLVAVFATLTKKSIFQAVFGE